MDKKINLKIFLENSDFEIGSGAQTSNGWVDDELTNVFQLVFKDIDVKTSITNKYKYSGYNSLQVDINSMGEAKDSVVLLRMNTRFKKLVDSENIDELSTLENIDIKTIQQKFESIKFKLSFWANTDYSKDIDVHKIYITKHIPDELNVPSIIDIDFDLNTNGIWKRFEKEFEVSTKDLTEELLLYICLGYGQKESKGKGNFDTIEFTIISTVAKTENAQANLPIDFNSENLQPIPRDLIPIFLNYLETCNITSDQRAPLENDTAYSFAALLELWEREGLDFRAFDAFVNDRYPNYSPAIREFLERNGISASDLKEPDEEPTLRNIIESEYGESISSLLLFYTKVILSTIADNPEVLLNSPASESTAQLRALVQSLKEKSNNVDQLRTLDLLETVLDKYDHIPYQSISNVLTPEERSQVLPSLKETNQITNQLTESASNAVLQLIDAGSSKRIPEYEFRIGNDPLPSRSQQKMDYLMSIIGGIDSSKNRTDYSQWLPGYFSTGGGVANEIVQEATRRNTLNDIFAMSIDDGLNNYSTLDANPALRKYVSANLASEFADQSYGIRGKIFNTLGDFAGAFLTLFGDGREKDKFETYFVKNAEKLTNNALKNGFIDPEGNYHGPVKMDDYTRNFASSAAATAAYEGFKNSGNTLKNIPYGLSNSVGINPIGDFYPNSLGSVYYPDARKGIANSPLSYSPSVPKMIGDNLRNYLPSDAVRSIQGQVFQKPELFRNTRFDGSFINNQDFRKNLERYSTSDFRQSQIQSAINKAYAANNFQRADGTFPKFAAVGNELIGNVSKRIGAPFNSRYSPLSNLLPIAAAPFAGASKFLGSAGVPYLPGNQRFYNEAYGPRALASKDTRLPNSYNPEVLRRLMEHEASFSSPVRFDDGGSKSTRRPKYSKEQMEQYRKYQEAMKNGSYGKRKPKMSAERRAYLKAQEQEERARERLRITPVSGAIAGGIIGTVTGLPALGTGILAFTGAPALELLQGLALLTGAGRGVNLPWWVPSTHWLATIGEYTGLTLPSLRIDGAGNYSDSRVIANNRRIKYFNQLFDRVPLLGSFFKSYDIDRRGESMIVTYFRRQDIRNTTSSVNFNAAASNALALQNGLNRAGFLSPSQAPFFVFRRNSAQITSGLLGLTDPLRRDQGMINSFFYFFDSIPKSLISIGNGISGIYGMLPDHVREFIAQHTFGTIAYTTTRGVTTFTGRSGLGRVYNYFFGTTDTARRNPFSQTIRFNRVYNNTFFHIYFGTLGRAKKFMGFLGDPASYIQAKLIEFLRYLTREATIFLTKKAIQILNPILASLKKALVSYASSTLAALGLTVGVGCLIIAAIMAIGLLGMSAIISSNQQAYNSGGLGGGTDASQVANNPGSSGGVGQYPDGICPLGKPNESLICTQPGNGAFTHHRMRTKAADISRPDGSDLNAVVNGTVKLLGPSCGGSASYAGTTAVLIGNDGIFYYYLHTMAAKEGPIEQGKPFAQVFNGRSDSCYTGPHSHLQIFKPVDPKMQLKGQYTPKEGQWLNTLNVVLNSWKCNLAKSGPGDNICQPGDQYCDPNVPTTVYGSCPKVVDKEDRSDTTYNP